jgi:hypothetical protein
MEAHMEDFNLRLEASRQDVELEAEDVGSRLRWQALQRGVRAARRDLKRRLLVEGLERNCLVMERDRLVLRRDRLEQEMEFVHDVLMGLEQVEQRGLSQEEVEAATEGRDTATGEEADCPICLAPMVPGEATLALRRCACRRAFHAACLSRWLEGSPSCPLCRGQARDMG